MIDDGCAEVFVSLSTKGLKLSSVKSINLVWLLSTRCEQLDSGKPLVDLLKGLAAGLQAQIQVNICSFEDPHHTWEAVFRGVGIALSKIFTPKVKKDFKSISKLVYRKTAETQIKLQVAFPKKAKNKSLLMSIAP